MVFITNNYIGRLLTPSQILGKPLNKHHLYLTHLYRWDLTQPLSYTTKNIFKDAAI